MALRKIVFQKEFKEDPSKQIQWNAFIKKNKLNADTNFVSVIEKLQDFIEPIFVMKENKKWNPVKWSWE